MLRREHIEEMLQERQVFTHDPAVERQRPVEVAMCIAEKRAAQLARPTWIDDGFFAAWMLCWPFWPQKDSYTKFIRSARRELFEGAPVEEAVDRARRFFQDEFLKLELYQLGEILNREGALEEPLEGPQVREIDMYDAGMLRETEVPRLRGRVFVRMNV